MEVNKMDNDSGQISIKDLPDICRPWQVAAAMGISLGTLASWRHAGNGPKYLKCNRLVRYRRDDVVAFLKDSEIATAKGPDEV